MRPAVFSRSLTLSLVSVSSSIRSSGRVEPAFSASRHIFSSRLNMLSGLLEQLLMAAVAAWIHMSSTSPWQPNTSGLSSFAGVSSISSTTIDWLS